MGSVCQDWVPPAANYTSRLSLEGSGPGGIKLAWGQGAKRDQGNMPIGFGSSSRNDPVPQNSRQKERRHNPTAMRPKPGKEAVIVSYASDGRQATQNLEDLGLMEVRICAALPHVECTDIPGSLHVLVAIPCTMHSKDAQNLVDEPCSCQRYMRAFAAEG